MSSPIANLTPTLLQRKLVGLHQKKVHANRILILSYYLRNAIERLFEPHLDQDIRGLDVGCGDMTIAENLSISIPSIKWTCTDLYELPANLAITEKWKKYCRYDGRSFPFDSNSFEFVLFCDVLHHCMPVTETLLREASRVGRYVIVKDHYEWGIYSRCMLRLMDFFGNYGYGVRIPYRYFSQKSFQITCQKSGLKIKHIYDKVDIYHAYPIASFLLKANWQFIAILEKA